jgi:hypothetical protein
MAEPLDETYLKWLYSQVAAPRVRTPERKYWRLLRQLYVTEFVWIVANDDNRVEDGRELRIDFLTENPSIEANEDWMGLGCSFLEMLIGLSRRISFEADGTPKQWFWKLLENIDLQGCSDASDITTEEIYEKVHRVIWRTYESNGTGGLFPHKHNKDDQRRVELWYQLQGYLLDDHE